MDTFNQAIKIWKAFSKEVMPIQPEFNNIDVKTLVGNLFCPGPWYSFRFEINQGYFSYMHSSAREFYGKGENDIILSDLIDRIHPDDHNFFIESEALVADFLTEKINPMRYSSTNLSIPIAFVYLMENIAISYISALLLPVERKAI
jgi:hypothetical protein